MIRLNCDYLEGCHPAILEALAQTNLEQTVGYGLDPHCEHAAEMIRETFDCPDAAVHFLVGGTQANTTVIAAALRPWEGVISPVTGHINVHETGAVEATGHKVLALPAKDGRISAPQVSVACDVFTVGGTKVGALFGEAVVITNPKLNHCFRYMIKQKGGMLAKGRLLGIQFETLLAENRYMAIAKKAVNQAMRIRDTFLSKGIPLYVDSPTNQLFPIFTDEQMEKLEEAFDLSPWERLDESRAVFRLCTSWATPDEYVDQFIAAIENL